MTQKDTCTWEQYIGYLHYREFKGWVRRLCISTDNVQLEYILLGVCQLATASCTLNYGYQIKFNSPSTIMRGLRSHPPPLVSAQYFDVSC
jgi:hypothetical protein